MYNHYSIVEKLMIPYSFFKSYVNMCNLNFMNSVSFRTCIKPQRNVGHRTLDVTFSRTGNFFIRICCLWDDLPLKSGSLSPCHFFVGIFTGCGTSVHKLPLVSILFCILRTLYSYFGCRKKCTRQSRRALWVVLRAMFLKEI